MRIQRKLLINFMGVSAAIIFAYALISLNAFQSGLENELRNRGAKGMELVLNRFQYFRETARIGADVSIRNDELIRAFERRRQGPVFRHLELIQSETRVDLIELVTPGGFRVRFPGPPRFERPEELFYLADLPGPTEPAAIRSIEDELFLVARSRRATEQGSRGRSTEALAAHRIDEEFMDRLKKSTGFDTVLFQNQKSVFSTLLGEGDRRLDDYRLENDLFVRLDKMNYKAVQGVYVLREEDFFDRPYQLAFAPLFPGDDSLEHYFLMVAFEIDYVKEAFNDYVYRSLGIAALGLLIVTLFSYFIARSISGPIARLSERMRALRRDEFAPDTSSAEQDEPAQGDRHKEEIRILEESFDAMIEAVRDSRRTIREYTEGLEVKVQERTAALREKMSQLENSRIALESEIEERRKTEKELLRAKEKAEVADRAKSQFLAIMSHEIRTPMNSILGMADLLSETELNPEQRRYIEIFKGSGDALVKIINDILDISRVDLGEMRIEQIAFDPFDLIHNIVILLNDRFQSKQIRFVQEIAANVPRRLIGDPSRLRQILLNLLDNALKFTEAGQIKLAVVRTDSPETFEHGVCPLRFVVEDTGIGIDSEKIETIFEHFTQADSSPTRAHGGTGLGLTIVKRLVEMLGGQVSVHSVPGGGSRFEFELGFRTPAQEEAPGIRPGPPAAGRQQATGRVLLVEDNEDNILLTELFLKKEAVELDIARNGQEALDMIKSGTPYDLVLMDIQMPVMDGYTAMREIRAWEQANDRKRLPVMALTAYALKEDIQRCYDAGCDKHFVKPIKKQDLIELIRKTTAGEN